MRSAPGTFILASILIVIFGLVIYADATGADTGLLTWGALTADVQRGEVWRLVTYAFLHRTWRHILFNVTMLLFTGWVVERRVGTARAALIFGLSGILSGAAILMACFRCSAIGASGGIFGLQGTGLILIYRADMSRFGQGARLRTAMWVWLGIGVAISLIPGVSLVGHIAGLIAGIILGMLINGRHEAAWFRIS